MILHEKTKEQFGYTFEEATLFKKFVCICDYCGAEFLREKRSILVGATILKDKHACSEKGCARSKREESQMVKYGVKNAGGTRESQEKAKQTWLENYGVENAAKAESVKNKQKATCLERFGKTSYLGTEQSKEDRRAASLEQYGVEYFSQAEEVQQKVKETNLKNLGVERPTQSEAVLKKRKENCLKEHGVENTTQLEEVKNKMKATMLERHGVEHNSQMPDFNDKFKATCLGRYGVEHYNKTEEFKERFKATCLDRYGVDHPHKLEETKIKIRNTCILKYGTPYPTKKVRKEQNKLMEWLNSFGFNFKSNYEILKGQEIDLYEETLKIGIEYNGLYWHNELSPEPREANYHFSKYKKCKEQGVRLITIFEDEWLTRQTQCKNFIKSVLSKNQNKIHGRKCEIMEVNKPDALNFINTNHIQGATTNILKAFGLEFNGELVGIITMGLHHRKTSKDLVVLNRMCFSDNVNISGGANKLFKKCIVWANECGFKEIISWSDNRWTEGGVYEKMGFKLEQIHRPDYSYVDMKRGRGRYSKQSKKNLMKNRPEGATRSDYCASIGLGRIWDCGKKKWTYHIS